MPDTDNTDKPDPPKAYLGHFDNPLLWFESGGVDWWRDTMRRGGPMGKILIVQLPCRVVVNLTPESKNVAQGSVYVAFNFPSLGVHVIPKEVADAMCIVRDGRIVQGEAPLQSRPVDAPDLQPVAGLRPPDYEVRNPSSKKSKARV